MVELWTGYADSEKEDWATEPINLKEKVFNQSLRGDQDRRGLWRIRNCISKKLERWNACFKKEEAHAHSPCGAYICQQLTGVETNELGLSIKSNTISLHADSQHGLPDLDARLSC